MGWEQIFSQPGETGSDEFGYSVEISENYAIVGASAFDGGLVSGRGKGYFYLKKY